MSESRAKSLPDEINNRKLQHIRIVKEESVEPVPSPYGKYSLPWKALPEIDYAEIDTSYELLGKKLSFPFFVGAMTGGPGKAEVINRNLAIACEQAGVGLALGSSRVILRDTDALKSFQVRELCPSIPLFANLGIVQFNYGMGADEVNKILDLTQADGIFLHINHLQEVMQPEGDTNFKDLIPKLEKILPKIKKPVFIKEVGAGIDFETAKRLVQIGVEWIDVSGLGGTSWTLVEAFRREDDLGFNFADVGIATDEALKQCSSIPGVKLIAGSGIRSGVDLAKAIMLGAELGSAAKPMLEPALESSSACLAQIERYKKEFRIAMFSGGFAKVAELKNILLTNNHE